MDATIIRKAAKQIAGSWEISVDEAVEILNAQMPEPVVFCTELVSISVMKDNFIGFWKQHNDTQFPPLRRVPALVIPEPEAVESKADFFEAGRILARADLAGWSALDMIGFRRSRTEVKLQVDLWAGRNITVEEWEDATQGYQQVYGGSDAERPNHEAERYAEEAPVRAAERGYDDDLPF